MTEEPNPVIERLKIQGDKLYFDLKSKVVVPEAADYQGRVGFGPQWYDRKGSVPMPGSIRFPKFKFNPIEAALNLLRIKPRDPGAKPEEYYGTEVPPLSTEKYPGAI